MNSGGQSNLARASASGSQKIATVPRSPELLAIITNESEQADFYYVEDLNEEDEDDCDDTCLDCRLEEFTQSDMFFDEVYSIIDFYHSVDNQDEPTACPCSATAPAQPEPPIPYPIEHWKDKGGDEWWGFWVNGRFVNFGSKRSAEFGRGQQLNNTDELFWSYRDLTGATRLEGLMSGYINVTVVGSLGKDPEIRSTGSGKKVASFSVAVDQGYGESKKTEWVNIIAWEKLADLAEKFLKKARPSPCLEPFRPPRGTTRPLDKSGTKLRSWLGILRSWTQAREEVTAPPEPLLSLRGSRRLRRLGQQPRLKNRLMTGQIFRSDEDISNPTAHRRRPAGFLGSGPHSLCNDRCWMPATPCGSHTSILAGRGAQAVLCRGAEGGVRIHVGF